jgi:hypothetical protein
LLRSELVRSVGDHAECIWCVLHILFI